METREEILKRINWDYTYPVADQERILAGDDLKAKITIYLKLLKSVRWYNLKSILTEKELQEILSPEIVDRVWIPSRREKYVNARQLLYGQTH